MPGNDSLLLRAEILRLVGLIPAGRFATYGTIAAHLNINPRRVAFFLARLDGEEAKSLPWHRVVAAEGRVSPNMDPSTRAEQVRRLEEEGLLVDARGYLRDPDTHFFSVGPSRKLRPLRD